MPPLILDYATGIKRGETIILMPDREIYRKVYPTGGMAFNFGITRFSTYLGQTYKVKTVREENYINRKFETFELYGNEYIYPPWLVQVVHREPQWEV